MADLNGWIPDVAITAGYIAVYCALSAGASWTLNSTVLNNHPASPGTALFLTVLWLAILVAVRQVYVSVVGHLAPTHLNALEGLTLLVAAFYLFWARLKKKSR